MNHASKIVSRWRARWRSGCDWLISHIAVRRVAWGCPVRMERRPKSSLVFVLASGAIVLAVLFVTYRLVDPLPPRHLVIAAALPGSER